MNDELLHSPTRGGLRDREKILQDPDTMSCNKGYDISADGYDTETGRIRGMVSSIVGILSENRPSVYL